ncbi:MAG: protein kinase, partial [Acidobacteria bacterium]|nr:protein kinase [Acidobacteriota bacterium]
TESLKYAHEQKVVHRTLCPRNILVINPKKQFPKIRILNWATARNDGQSSSLTLHVTTHLDQFVDAEQAAYLAPESLRAVDQDAELLDVFALGALAYHLFSGIPPAESADHLVEKLTTGGLRLSAVLDGVTRALDDLIESATLPDVSHRLASVRAFAEGLDGVEEELTAPAPKEPEFDPAAIPVGSMLNNQFKVLNRLGQGATAIAFLVESDGIRKVLKLADHPNHNDDLLAEHRVLEKLNHKRVVSLLPPNLVEIHGHVGLLLRPADLGTLGDRLRRGRIQLELLQRFGEDLLEALHYLETMGLPHRDIKPDNIGEVEEGKNDERHLMLFDFSLANKPYEDIRSGTPAYRDPFLVKRKRWDPHADRFSAALTLYEMATGHLPRWGDGRSEPALIAEEVHIESELFEPVTRLALTQFFAKALARETAKRFDTAAQMNMAWRQAFQRITQSGSGLTPHGPSGLDLEHLHLESSITELNLSALELQALESADLTCIADLLEREPLYFLKLRGAARDTRHQLHKLALKLQKHFQKVRKSEPNNGLPAVDQLFGWLYPREAAQTRILRAFFEGILPDETALETITPHAVAQALGLTVIDVFRVLGLFRARIQKRFSRPFGQLMEIMKTTLLREGGIISLPVLAERVLRVLGSSAAESERKTMAWAVTRAGLVYGEDTRKQVFWRTQIVGERVAITWDADGHAQARIHALTNLVQELDDLADQLPPLETIHSLLHNQQQNWDDPTEMRVLDPLSRLRVALQFTARARLSSRNEIYPKGLPAARALSLGRNALIGLSKVSIQDLRTRIQNRYLEAEPLPDRPELDGLLQASGSSLVWDPHKGAYTYPQADQMGATFLGTQHTSQRFQSKAQGDQLKHEYQRLEERLQYSAQNGGLLFLMVAPHAYRSAAQHLQSRFNPQLLNADLWLIQSLKAEAQQRKVDWRVVREADAKPGSSDWQKLNRLVQLSQARWSNLPDSGASPLLMTHPGLLARYDLMETFSLWREQCRKRALWVLVAGYAQVDGPILDGKPLPILTANEWARVPQSWAEQVG